MAGNVYSFINCVCTLNDAATGTVLSLGNGAGNAAEGITFTHTEEKTTVVTGADGTIMQSLHAGMTGRMMIRLLKTSPLNNALSNLYNAQRLGGAVTWGQNQILINEIASGDVIEGSNMAFVKHPDIVYATEGNVNDWELVGYIVPELGGGVAGLVGLGVA